MIVSFMRDEQLNSIHVDGASMNCADYSQPTLYFEMTRAKTLQQYTVEQLIDFFSLIDEKDVITITSDDEAHELYRGKGFQLTNVSVNIRTEMDPSFEQGIAKNNTIQIYFSYPSPIGGSDIGPLVTVQEEGVTNIWNG